MNQEALIEKTLFDAYTHGDESAFARIYQTLKGDIYMFALKITKSREDAEDIVLQTFTKLWEHKARIESPLHMRRWAFLTSRNLCINILRDKRAPRALTDQILSETQDSGSGEDILEQEMVWAAVVERLWEIVHSLPPMRRKVLLMRFRENKSMEEIASLLGLRPQTVYNHMAKAKEQMRKLLYKVNFKETEMVILLFILSLSNYHNHPF